MSSRSYESISNVPPLVYTHPEKFFSSTSGTFSSCILSNSSHTRLLYHGCCGIMGTSLCQGWTQQSPLIDFFCASLTTNNAKHVQHGLLAIAHALLLLCGRREETFCPFATRWSKAKTVDLISLLTKTNPFPWFFFFFFNDSIKL